MFRSLPLVAICALVLPMSASAYIGPGMGAGVISAIVGVLAAIGLTIFSLFYYPIKRAMKKRRQASEEDAPAEAEK